MKDKKKMNEQRKGKMQKMVLMTLAMMTLLYTNGLVVYASGNYGQNAANWILDQVFWIALVAIVGLILLCVVKKNNTGALATGLVGAVVLFLIKNPTKLAEVGDNIMGNVFK